MNLRDLRYLLAVAEHAHFGRAAQACGISQPTLSVQLRRLEEQLGVALFERTSRAVAPTLACERLIGHARAAVAEVEAMLSVARTLRDPLAGRFRLGIIPTLAPYLLPLVFAPLREALPALDIEPWEDQTSALLERLRGHELDAALLATETMMSTGHLPKSQDDMYAIERDDLWAIPTAEVPLTSMHRNEILDAAALPIRMTAQTPCFRREAGSAGRDTRGLLRVHEFDKVELFAYCLPEQAPAAHADILARAEGLLQKLGLTYRVLDLCAGDLGTSSARTVDLEVFSPGVDRWLEVSSVSWFRDFQARRANVRYRTETGTQFVHTVNGSALAWARIWAAVVETNRLEDGSVKIPDVLVPYLGGQTHLAAPTS